MPENPILQSIESPQMPVMDDRTDGEVVGKAVASIADTASSVVDNARVNNFANEVVQAEDKYNIALKADQERLKREIDKIDAAQGKGPVAEMARAMAKTDLLKSQKKVDSSMIAVMKEDIFRRWANRYPSLAPDFVEVAKNSGLGTKFVSKETEFVTKEFNDQLAAEADSVTNFEAFEKKVAEYGLVRSDPRWAGDPVGFIKAGSDALALDNASQTSERLNKIALNDLKSNDVDADRDIGQLVFENSDSYRQQILGNISVLGNAFSVQDTQLLAQMGIGSIPQAQSMAEEQLLANRDKVRQRLMQPYIDRGIPVNMTKINEYLNDYVEQGKSMIALFGVDDFSGVVTLKRKLVEEGAEDALVDPQTAARIRILTKGAEFSGSAKAEVENTYAKLALAWSSSALGIDTNNTYSIRDENGDYQQNTGNSITDVAGANAKNISEVYNFLYKNHIPQIREAMAQTEDPELQRTALMDLVDKAEAFKALYSSGKNAPDPLLVKELFATLTSPVVPDILALGGYSDEDMLRIEKSLETLATHEASSIGTEALEAMKKVRATVTGTRPLSEEEKVLFAEAGFSDEGAGKLRAPASSKGDIYLDIDSDYRVFFASSTTAGKPVAASLNASGYAQRMSIYTQGLSRFYGGDPKEMLGMLTLLPGSNMPREFIHPDAKEEAAE